MLYFLTKDAVFFRCSFRSRFERLRNNDFRVIISVLLLVRLALKSMRRALSYPVVRRGKGGTAQVLGLK